ncbi:MAG TPA: hypothetical protein VGF01_02150 [Terracidiphilus sp.]|jgi:hypothetical protein
MNQSKIFRNEATHAEFDRRIDGILAADDELIPSSGFMASVMERVQEEAAAPPPIPFPWKRLIPVVLTVAGVTVWAVYEFIHQRMTLPNATVSKSYLPLLMQLPMISVASIHQVVWLALALGVALLSWMLSRRLAGSGGLL